MIDEMRYLQTEFIGLSTTIHEKYPNAQQRWSLIVYRDIGDEYVVREFEFESDPAKYQQTLARQVATAGGDFPEAPEQALAKAARLSWRTTDDAAKLAFWVADAPYHTENAAAMGTAIKALADKSVHVYPVASSGINEFTELAMRSTAQLTGGRYLFLTDDSGVGNSHKEPSIPCYYVTRLDQAMARVIDIEISGVYHGPAADQIIRSEGQPRDGACQREAGTLYAF